MTQLVAGLIIFFAVHAVPMIQKLRTAIADKIGLVMYQALFALASFVGLVLLVRGYGAATHLTLWDPPEWGIHATFLLMLPVFPLLVSAYLPGKLRQWIPHPMLLAVKIWAVAHLIANGDLASLLLFGSFLAYGVIDLISIKRRQRAKGVVPKTGPLLNDGIATVVGLALYAGMILWGHGALIGVSFVG